MALVCGGMLVGTADGALGAGADDDLATLRLLAAGEALAVELYERASAAASLPPALASWIDGALANERDHEAALRAAAPALVVGPVNLAHADTLASSSGVLRLALALESALVGAYLGAVATLRSAELRVMAAAIGANEAQHLAAVRRLAASRLLPDPALPAATSAGQARRALAAEVAGSQLPW